MLFLLSPYHYSQPFAAKSGGKITIALFDDSGLELACTGLALLCQGLGLSKIGFIPYGLIQGDKTGFSLALPHVCRSASGPVRHWDLEPRGKVPAATSHKLAFAVALPVCQSEANSASSPSRENQYRAALGLSCAAGLIHPQLIEPLTAMGLRSQMREPLKTSDYRD